MGPFRPTLHARYAEVFKALSAPNRLRLYWLLATIDQRICVAEAMDVLGASHYNASRDLKTLEKAGLVMAERDGKWVFYTLREEPDHFVRLLLDAVKAIPAKQFAVEVRRCRERLAMRVEGRCVVGPTRPLTASGER